MNVSNISELIVYVFTSFKCKLYVIYLVFSSLIISGKGRKNNSKIYKSKINI